MLLGTARGEGASFCATALNMTKTEFEAWSKQAMPGMDTTKILEPYSGHDLTKNKAGLVHGEWFWASAKCTGNVDFHCGSRMGAR